MAHVKGSGKVRQHHQRPGKRLGVKKFGGQAITTGQIILRQRGVVYKPAKGVGMGRDNTIFAMQDGKVTFGKHHGKTTVSVIAQ